MEVAQYPVHGQSVERAVKEVTKAATAMFGAESRGGWMSEAGAQGDDWARRQVEKGPFQDLPVSG